MPYEPDGNALRRVTERVGEAVREAEKDPLFGVARLKEVPADVLDAVLRGEWVDEASRNAVEQALLWKAGDIEWVARGGEPTRLTRDDSHRRWRVTLTIEKVVEAPTGQDAIKEVCGPIREAAGSGHAGIAEVQATNLRLLKQRQEEQRPGTG